MLVLYVVGKVMFVGMPGAEVKAAVVALGYPVDGA